MYHVSFLLLTWVLCVSGSNMSVMVGCGLMVGWGMRSGLGGQGRDHWRGEVRLDHCNKERDRIKYGNHNVREERVIIRNQNHDNDSTVLD